MSALRRRDVDAKTGVVRVRQTFTEIRGVGLVAGPPKSRAGLRTVTLPASVLPVLRSHLAEFTDDEPDTLIFTGPKGAPIRRGNFNPLVRWSAAVEKAGVPGPHFHDLRHTGNTVAARAGASTRELMARMGHDSPQAALICQHATAEADRAIAAAVDRAMTAEQKKEKKAGDKSKKKAGKKAKKDSAA